MILEHYTLLFANVPMWLKVGKTSPNRAGVAEPRLKIWYTNLIQHLGHKFGTDRRTDGRTYGRTDRTTGSFYSCSATKKCRHVLWGLIFPQPIFVCNI